MKSKIKLLGLALGLSLFVVACGSKTVKTTEDDLGKPKVESNVEKDESGNNKSEESKEDAQVEETKQEKQIDESKENNQVEETKTETQAGTIVNSEPGKLDVNKLLDSLNGSKNEIKPFSVKITATQQLTKDGKTQNLKANSDMIFDGKTQFNKAKVGDAYNVSYSTIEGDKVIIINGIGTSEKDMSYSKRTDKVDGNIGVNIGFADGKRPEWKFEGANGNIEKYTTKIDAKSIENATTESLKFKDTSGAIDIIVEYDKSKNQIHSMQSKGGYKTTMVFTVDKNKGPVESKVEQAMDSKYTDFRFDGIEPIVIPEEAKNAMDFEAMQESLNEQLKELDKSLNDLKDLENKSE